MKRSLFLALLTTVVAWSSLLLGNARVDIDGRGEANKLEVLKAPENGTALNASWLQGEVSKQLVTVEARAAGDWKRASFSFKPEKDGKVLVKVQGSFRTGDTARLWIVYDDFEVTGAELKNPAFDGGADPWTLNEPSQYLSDQGHAKSGAIRACCFAVASQELIVKAGQPVTMSFWFKRLDGKSPLNIVTIGHSFHANWLPGWLKLVEEAAGEPVHEQIAISMLGGSRVIQHWNLPPEKNVAKSALEKGNIDILTMSPMLSPDEGIENFAKLALEHNPRICVTVQEFWLPFDRLDCFGEKSYGELATQLRNWQEPPLDPDPAKAKLDTAHFNIPSAEQLQKLHAPYFEKMNAYIVEQNKAFGKQVLFVVPVGQAVLALRENIIDGKAPGLNKQSELFIDNLGHPAPPICALSAYCHFAVIYHRSPVGLPAPAWMNRPDGKGRYPAELTPLLQQLAWDAVCQHPLSGTKEPGK
jgi:hypothetical protein